MNEQIIVFELNGQNYGINIEEVAEISKVLPITQLPKQPELEGVTDVRGSIHSVVSLRKIFGMEPKSIDDKSKLIILHHEKIALLTDDVTDMALISKDMMQDFTNISLFSKSNDLLSYVCEWKDTLVTVINVKAMFPSNKAVSSL